LSKRLIFSERKQTPKTMKVKIENVEKDIVNCNFCKKSEAVKYENVITFKGNGNGLSTSICKNCLDQLILKSTALGFS
jgi:hypothetical protein